MVCLVVRRAVVETILLRFVVKGTIIGVFIVFLLRQLLVVKLVGAKWERYGDTRESRSKVPLCCIVVDMVDGVL